MLTKYALEYRTYIITVGLFTVRVVQYWVLIELKKQQQQTLFMMEIMATKLTLTLPEN